MLGCYELTRNTGELQAAARQALHMLSKISTPPLAQSFQSNNSDWCSKYLDNEQPRLVCALKWSTPRNLNLLTLMP